MTLFFMVGFTMRMLEDCGAQLLAVLVLVRNDLLLDGLPATAMSPICPCYLPIAGTAVELGVTVLLGGLQVKAMSPPCLCYLPLAGGVVDFGVTVS